MATSEVPTTRQGTCWYCRSKDVDVVKGSLLAPMINFTPKYHYFCMKCASKAFTKPSTRQLFY